MERYGLGKLGSGATLLGKGHADPKLFLRLLDGQPDVSVCRVLQAKAEAQSDGSLVFAGEEKCGAEPLRSGVDVRRPLVSAALCIFRAVPKGNVLEGVQHRHSLSTTICFCSCIRVEPNDAVHADNSRDMHSIVLVVSPRGRQWTLADVAVQSGPSDFQTLPAPHAHVAHHYNRALIL